LAAHPPARAPAPSTPPAPLLFPSTPRRPCPAQRRVDQDTTRHCHRQTVALPGACRRGPPLHRRTAASHCPR
jgi:hypothetical protein